MAKTLKVSWDQKPKGYFVDKSFYNTAAWRGYSKRMRKDNNSCNSCKVPFYDISKLCVDHIIPIEQGGSKWSGDNHQVLCNSCHSKKTMKRDKQYTGEIILTNNGKIPKDFDGSLGDRG